MKIGYTVAKSPLGKVLIGATERGVSAVYLGETESALLAELHEEYPRAEIAPATDSFRKWVREIVQRIDGKQPRMELSLDLQATAFQRRVWQELQRIPRGRTRTYSGGAVAGPAESGARRGAGVLDESGLDRRAVPSRDSRRWDVGRIPLGPFAQGAAARTGTRGSGMSKHFE